MLLGAQTEGKLGLVWRLINLLVGVAVTRQKLVSGCYYLKLLTNKVSRSPESLGLTNCHGCSDCHHLGEIGFHSGFLFSWGKGTKRVVSLIPMRSR